MCGYRMVLLVLFVASPCDCMIDWELWEYHFILLAQEKKFKVGFLMSMYYLHNIVKSKYSLGVGCIGQSSTVVKKKH